MPEIMPAALAVITHVLETCSEEESQAKALVMEAKKPGSPLSSHFTWDLEEAAYQYHLEEARRLLIKAQVLIKLENRPPLVYRQFIKTSYEQPGYQTFERVAQCVELQESTKDRFLKEMQQVCLRYSQYGVPQVNALIRMVCRTLKLEAPKLFNGADIQRKGVGIG